MSRGETTRGETSWGAKRLAEEMDKGRNVPEPYFGEANKSNVTLKCMNLVPFIYSYQKKIC